MICSVFVISCQGRWVFLVIEDECCVSGTWRTTAPFPFKGLYKPHWVTAEDITVEIRNKESSLCGQRGTDVTILSGTKRFYISNPSVYLYVSFRMQLLCSICKTSVCTIIPWPKALGICNVLRTLRTNIQLPGDRKITKHYTFWQTALLTVMACY